MADRLCLLLMVMFCYVRNTIYSPLPTNDASKKSQADLLCSRKHFWVLCDSIPAEPLDKIPTPVPARTVMHKSILSDKNKLVMQHAYRLAGAAWCISRLVCGTKFPKATLYPVNTHSLAKPADKRDEITLRCSRTVTFLAIPVNRLEEMCACSLEDFPLIRF